MAVAVGWLTARFWRVGQPIFMSPDLDRMRTELATDPKKPEQRSAEYERVKEIYDAAAELNGVDSLLAYAARGLRYERIARDNTNNAPLRKLATADALQVRNDVLATLARAATNVVPQRAHEAVRSGRTVWAFGVFVFGLLSFGVGADYLDSERSGRIATAKACAEAITAIRTADPATNPPATANVLAELCGGKASVPDAGAASPATAATETSGAIKELATRYDACMTAEKDAVKCAPIRGALEAAVK